MKLVTYLSGGVSRAGVLREDGSLVDVSRAGDVLTIATDSAARAAASKLVAGKSKVAGRYKLRAPITPRAIICIGLNYMDHVRETNAKIPARPIVFAKFANALAHPGDTVTWHNDVCAQVDYEAELGVVIGRKAYRVPESKALAYVAGYTCINDISARDIQKSDSGGQWVMGKTPDGFMPMGPALVTADEIKDPQTLDISCVLNGQTMQSSNTREMIFGVAHLIAHLSNFMTLMPGDVIATGTGPGVGAARTPPVFMKDGDVCAIAVQGIGQLSNKMRVRM